MPRHADRVHAPTKPRPASPSAAARAQPRRPRPCEQAVIHQVLQRKAAGWAATASAAAPNRGGLPAGLKAGVEQLSGIAMDDVRVHRDSSEPAKLGALAFAQGSDIHLGPGQEQHLPHEAWHVVQQKQGRVRPTLQAKGVEINEDVGLEGEADRMGAKASAFPFAPARQDLREAPVAGGIVQGVLKFLGVLFKPVHSEADPVPDIFAALHSSPIDYHVRDDWNLSNHGVIHIIDGTRKYLLGEIHGSGDWQDETRPWSSIPKMRESGKAFPGVPAKAKPKAAAKAPGKVKKKALPLENIYAYFIHVTLGAHGILNEFRVNPAARPSLARLEGLIDFIDEMWSAALLTEQKESDLDPGNADHRRLGVFIIHCKNTYTPKTMALLETAKEIRAEVEKSIANKPAAVQNFTALVTAMIGEANFIPQLVQSLAAMIGIEAASPLGASIVAEAKSPAHVHLAESAANRVRENEMARNINAAKSPLLVQLGDLHVEPLAARVPGAVGLRRDQMLAEATALDLGPAKPGPAKPAAKPASGASASNPLAKAVVAPSGSKTPAKQG